MDQENLDYQEIIRHFQQTITNGGIVEMDTGEEKIEFSKDNMVVKEHDQDVVKFDKKVFQQAVTEGDIDTVMAYINEDVRLETRF